MSAGLRGSLREISERLEQSLVAEEASRRKGLLQALDARAKLAGLLALIVAASLTHNLAVLAGMYLLTLVLAASSAISVAFFAKRIWLALPFFTGVIALPALFLTPGAPLWRLPLGLVVTQTGATTVLFLLLRVGTSTSLALLLVLTTPWASLLRALTVLGVPDVLVLVLGMAYRYIYVLLRLTNDMFLSRQSRVVGPLPSGQERRLLGAVAATLLARSLQMSGEVYLAMQSRGFRGYGRVLRPGRLRWGDALWGGLVLLVVLVSILVRR